MRKRTFILLALSIWCVAGTNLLKSSYSIDFLITVETDKPVYNVGEIVNISGNLTYNGEPVSDALVAIQVNDCVGDVVYRTYDMGAHAPVIFPEGDVNKDLKVDIFDAVIVALAFGCNPDDPNWDPRADIIEDDLIDIFDMVVIALNFGETEAPYWKMEIIDAYIGDGTGNPVTNVERNSTYSINARIINNENYSISAVIAFTLYDLNNTPLFALGMGFVVEAHMLATAAASWRVPEEAEFGTATIYANAYSDYPQSHGTPYCPEKSSTFNIISSSGAGALGLSAKATTVAMQVSGGFNNSLCIPNEARLGNYTVYVATFYYTGEIGLIAYESITFQVLA